MEDRKLIEALSKMERQKRCNEEVDIICKKYNCAMIVNEIRRAGVTIKLEINYVPQEEVKNMFNKSSLTI